MNLLGTDMNNLHQKKVETGIKKEKTLKKYMENCIFIYRLHDAK